MEDITPELLEAIRKDFIEILGDAKIEQQNYIGASEYADKVGSALAEAFKKNLSSAVLPDGKMYWNIADRVVRPLMEDDHEMVAEAARQVQQALNEAAGIGLRAQISPLDNDRINGILNRISAADQYDDVAWLLDEPIRLFSLAVVDDTLKRNVEFQGKAGMKPRIIRRAERGCCKWCRNLEGTYDYPDLPGDVYRRHNNCRCTVEYDPGDGSRQNVWTKEWKDPDENDKIEARKQIGISNLTEADKVALNQYKSFESYLLNEALLEGTELTHEQVIMMERLDQALEKLPIYEGVTYRSLDKNRIRDLDAFWEKYKAGKRVTETAYTSTSTEVYDDTFEIQMIITGNSGRDMRPYTDFENEIVYPRNTRFNVTKREANTIWLEEI